LLPSPVERSTFEQSKLDPRQREAHADAVALHRDLIALRREDPVIANSKRRLDAVAISSDLLVLRYFGEAAGDRLLVVNFGGDVELAPIPEPLLAPPAGRTWRVIWNSEAAAYGGQGVPPLRADREWHVPGECALLLGDEALDASPLAESTDDR
jgi:maltooligosyltrehalose trehalohydrolase